MRERKENRLPISEFSPTEVVGMFISARMQGLELSVPDVVRNTNLSRQDVRKMLKGKLDFDKLLENLPDVENFLDFEPVELQALLLKLVLSPRK